MLEPDFGVLIAPGLQLAFEGREQVVLEGNTLRGESVTRSTPVCGPGAYVVLKPIEFGDRGEPKDAYDLVYVLRRGPGGAGAIVDRLEGRAMRSTEVVMRALEMLVRDFGAQDAIGSLRVAEFEGASGQQRDAVAADAFGFVDDLLWAYRRRGILPGGARRSAIVRPASVVEQFLSGLEHR